MNTINGFLVVYHPNKNRRHFLGRWIEMPLVCPYFSYRGRDRNEWEELRYSEVSGFLPDSLLKIYKKMETYSNQYSGGTYLTNDLQDAIKALKFSNECYPNGNEIIAIHSKIVTSIQGEFGTEATIRWIGYDLVGIGEWSLIAHGVLDFDPMLEKWRHHLNEYGLFPEGDLMKNWALAEELIRDYDQYAKQDRTEPMGPDKPSIDLMHIGIVQLNEKELERAEEWSNL
ncbi:MAG: hypothetical protein Tsb0021_01860 [Chlamydiales bacterium]